MMKVYQIMNQTINHDARPTQSSGSFSEALDSAIRTQIDQRDLVEHAKRGNQWDKFVAQSFLIPTFWHEEVVDGVRQGKSERNVDKTSEPEKASDDKEGRRGE